MINEIGWLIFSLGICFVILYCLSAILYFYHFFGTNENEMIEYYKRNWKNRKKLTRKRNEKECK